MVDFLETIHITWSDASLTGFAIMFSCHARINSLTLLLNLLILKGRHNKRTLTETYPVVREFFQALPRPSIHSPQSSGAPALERAK